MTYNKRAVILKSGRVRCNARYYLRANEDISSEGVHFDIRFG